MKKAQLITAACAALMWTATVGAPTAAAQGPPGGAGSPSGTQAGSSSGATAAPADLPGEQDDMSTRTSARSDASELQRFVEKASVANMAEIQLGQLALERAQDPQVKQFAQTMIDNYTTAQEQLTSAATSQNIPVPTALDDKHQKLHDKLAKLQGAEFDRGYMDAIVDGHKDVEKLLKKRGERSKSTAANAPSDGASGAVGTSGTSDTSGASGAAGTSGAKPENESASASAADAERSASSTASAAESASGAPSSPDEWAALTLPKVRAHLEQARALEDQVKQAERSNDINREPDANIPQPPSPAGTNPPSGATPPR